MSDKIVWVDVETTAFKPDDGLLLEVGFRITDLDLNVYDTFSRTIGHRHKMLEQAFVEADQFVKDMHTKNNLFNACEDSPLVDEIEGILCGWIHEVGAVNQPLAGASLGQVDRPFLEYFMPTAYSLFHYRSIDVSTVKELCRRYNPELFKHAPEKETDHRVDTCLTGTIEEFKFYQTNFIFDGRE